MSEPQIPTCTKARHYFRWLPESNDLGGAQHKCECGQVYTDRLLNLRDVRVAYLLPSESSGGTTETASPSLREVEVARSVGRLEEALRAARWLLEVAEDFLRSEYPQGPSELPADDEAARLARAVAGARAALVGVEPPPGQPLVDPERPPDAVFDELRALHGLGSPGSAGSVVEDSGLSGGSE